MNSLKKVVVTDYSFPDIEIERNIISKAFDIDFTGYQCRNEEEVCEVVTGVDVLMVQFAPVTKKVIDCMEPGKTIIRYGVGYDNIDLKAAKQKGISVAYVPDYCKDEVADHTVTLLLSMLRRIPLLYQSVSNGYWQGVKTIQEVPPFKQTKIGFFGLGRIGYEVLKRLKPFGFKFLINDPYQEKEQIQKMGAKLLTGDDFWKQADAFTLHAPSTEETVHAINKEVFAKMKKSAVVVNTARGNLVDELALSEALQTGEIAGAAIDVFEKEPLPLDSVLCHAPRLLATPHVAWYSNESMVRLQRLAAEEAVRSLRGEALRCPLNE